MQSDEGQPTGGKISHPDLLPFPCTRASFCPGWRLMSWDGFEQKGTRAIGAHAQEEGPSREMSFVHAAAALSARRRESEERGWRVSGEPPTLSKISRQNQKLPLAHAAAST